MILISDEARYIAFWLWRMVFDVNRTTSFVSAMMVTG